MNCVFYFGQWFGCGWQMFFDMDDDCVVGVQVDQVGVVVLGQYVIVEGSFQDFWVGCDFGVVSVGE